MISHEGKIYTHFKKQREREEDESRGSFKLST